ncbi:MAG: hypothetical protein R3F31_26780 [Verrucomicrobiales bacterium]
MEVYYNSYIIKLRGISWPKDKAAIEQAVMSCRGSSIILRVSQAPIAKMEVEITHTPPLQAIEGSGIDLTRSFNVEVIVRDPLALGRITDALEGHPGYVDQNDFNTLQWCGARGTGNLTSRSGRSAPMFFRENGMNVDLVNVWYGQSVFLILNGPSFASIDQALLRRPGILTFGVNNGSHVFRTNFWTCVDDPKRFMGSIWRDPAIMKFVPMAHFQKPIWDHITVSESVLKVGECPGVLGYRRNERFDAQQWLHEDTVNWGNHGKLGGGRSVMLAALRICFLLGFRQVYLLGCDFYMSADCRYWFPEQRSVNAIHGNMAGYNSMDRYFNELKPHFDSAGFKVFNCNRLSNLKVFPFVECADAIARSGIENSESTEGMYVDRK